MVTWILESNRYRSYLFERNPTSLPPFHFFPQYDRTVIWSGGDLIRRQELTPGTW